MWIEKPTTSQKYIRSLPVNTKDCDLSRKRAVMVTSVLRGLKKRTMGRPSAQIGTKLIVGYPSHRSCVRYSKRQVLFLSLAANSLS